MTPLLAPHRLEAMPKIVIADRISERRLALLRQSGWPIATASAMAGFVDGMGAGISLGRSGFFDNFVVMFDHRKLPPSFEIDKIAWPS